MKKEIKKIQTQEESDDTDSEEVLSRVGRIPFQWYENFKHFGYDVNAQKIIKQKQDDQIDDFIKKNENPNWWRTIRDHLNDKDVVLTDEQLNMLDRIRKGKFADRSISKNDYSVEYDWNEGMFPLSAAPVSKKSFLPSKYERIMVNKLVQAIQLGRITIKKDNQQQEQEVLNDVWEHEGDQLKNRLETISAPKLTLPGHNESYNPSAEYLLDAVEKKALEEMDLDERTQNFIPKAHQNLRQVEAYGNFVKERFERCLDLYLCPRLRKKRLNMTAEELLPKLPKPNELRPFPTLPTVYFDGHNHRVLSIVLDHDGQYMASSDTSGLILIHEVSSSRILQQIQFDQKVTSLDWKNGVLLAAISGWVVFIETDYQSWEKKPISMNNEMVTKKEKFNFDEKSEQLGQWEFFGPQSIMYDQGVRGRVYCGDNQIQQVVFHVKGEYFATLAPKAEKRNEQVLVHNFLKCESQKPFQKSKGDLQKVQFHPKKPFFFLVTNKNTYIYNLQTQSMTKKLVSGAQINSCIAIHPSGDNIIVGTHDRRICWFDLDLSNTPYKTLRYHSRSIRSVQFHQKYPLFASCSDDGTIHVFHSMVYNDLMQNALIVPLKVLKGHQMTDDLGVMDIKFHPTQPWLISAGADHRIIMWT